MTLKQQIERELDRLAQAGDLSLAAGDFRLDVDDGRLEGGILAVDKLACAFDRFSLLTDRLANVSIDELKQLSDRLAAKLNYLLEPISPVALRRPRVTRNEPSAPVVQSAPALSAPSPAPQASVSPGEFAPGSALAPKPRVRRAR